MLFLNRAAFASQAFMVSSILVACLSQQGAALGIGQEEEFKRAMGCKILLCRNRQDRNVSVAEIKFLVLATPLASVLGGVSGLYPSLVQHKPLTR